MQANANIIGTIDRAAFEAQPQLETPLEEQDGATEISSFVGMITKYNGGRLTSHRKRLIEGSPINNGLGMLLNLTGKISSLV